MDSTVFHQLSYGVYVLSTYDEAGKRSTGCTVNSVMQITSDPAIVAVSVNHLNYTNTCIDSSGKFAVSILGESSLPLIIGTFGFRSGRDFDKFAAFESRESNGIKVLHDACGYFTCEVIGKTETPTHTVFLGKVVEAEKLKADTPMTYSYYHKVIKGKTAKNAPTYVAE